MSIEVGRTAFGLGPSRLFADDRTTVSHFLNELYFEIADFVGPFRYGLEWVLIDAVTDQRLVDIGSYWARATARERDDRLLSTIGVGPSSRLRIARVTDAEHRMRRTR